MTKELFYLQEKEERYLLLQKGQGVPTVRFWLLRILLYSGPSHFMMAVQGLGPSLFQCVCCGCPVEEGGELFFSQENHGVLDKGCLSQVTDGRRISATALYTMKYMICAPLEKLYTFTVKEEVLHELEQQIHTYVGRNTDRRFKSLEILEMMV